MEKFLRSRVGQPWDKIFSEIAQEFKKRNLERHEMERSLAHYVEMNCWKGAESGKIYNSKGVELSAQPIYKRDQFYVHPLSKCLAIILYKKKKKDDKPKDFIKIDETRAYEKTNGCWFLVTYKKNEYYAEWMKYRPDLTQVEKDIYSREYTTSERKQLSSKELKQAGLVNDPLVIKKKYKGDKVVLEVVPQASSSTVE